MHTPCRHGTLMTKALRKQWHTTPWLLIKSMNMVDLPIGQATRMLHYALTTCAMLSTFISFIQWCFYSGGQAAKQLSTLRWKYVVFSFLFPQHLLIIFKDILKEACSPQATSAAFGWILIGLFFERSKLIEQYCHFSNDLQEESIMKILHKVQQRLIWIATVSWDECQQAEKNLKDLSIMHLFKTHCQVFSYVCVSKKIAVIFAKVLFFTFFSFGGVHLQDEREDKKSLAHLFWRHSSARCLPIFEAVWWPDVEINLVKGNVF